VSCHAPPSWQFILYYIKVLEGRRGQEAKGMRELAQRAWNYLNDSLRLDCCVRYKAELVACAAIFMAARDLQVRT
jgi:cyclin L